MKLTSNFDLREFVPREIYIQFSDKSTRFLNGKLPLLAQFVRGYFDKPVTINNWHSGGPFQYSGYRPPDCPEGARLSSHKLGNAIDIRIDGLNALDVQKAIRENYERFQVFGLTAMEEGTLAWTHLSVEWTRSDKLILIPIPKK